MTEFILRAIAGGGYAGIALLMALENVFPPLPSEVIMGLGGIAVARGRFAFVPLVLVATIGATAGNFFWYWLGRRLGTARLRPFVERHGRWLTLEWEDIAALGHRFRTQGGRIVFTFRLLPNFRTLISLPAGMAGMPPVRFAAFTFAGAALWNSVLAGAGYVLETRFGLLDTIVGPLGIAMLAALLGLYLWRVATWRPRAAR